MELKLDGLKIGRLTVINQEGKNTHGDNLWVCRCECGNIIKASSQHLRLNQVKSCGCLEKERIEKARSIEYIAERFWKNVNIGKPNECWEWKPKPNKNGYGSFRLFIDGKWKDEGTHRIAYYLTTGEYPYNLLVCHSCDNKICCNPSHLWKGTYSDNSKDRETKKRGRYSKLKSNEIF